MSAPERVALALDCALGRVSQVAGAFAASNRGVRRVVLVTGLSGGGKSSVLRELEDLGYEAVDNPPLAMLEEMVTRGEGKLAIGVDARTRGFDADLCCRHGPSARRSGAAPGAGVHLGGRDDAAATLHGDAATASAGTAGPGGDGIEREEALTAPLRDGADLVIDTSDLPLASLRRLIERHFGAESDADESRLVVSLISFAYRQGLPREADLVFDARFLRNPHYDPMLRGSNGAGRRGRRLY